MAVEEAAASDLDVSPESEETEGREEDNKQEQGENKLDTSQVWIPYNWTFSLDYKISPNPAALALQKY